MRMKAAFYFLLVIAVTASGWPVGAQSEWGEYLVHAAGCADCHSPDLDKPFAGGYQLVTPFGVFVTPNLTPDRKTGIGNWTFRDFKRALRTGVSPSGFIYYPAFPYRSYSKITNQDLQKMWAYFRSLPPQDHPNHENQLLFPFDQRWLLRAWQWMFFPRRSADPDLAIKVSRGPFHPDSARSQEWNRGAYLVEALTHCTECHTPRNSLGGLEVSLWLAGSDVPVGGRKAPNITTDRFTGKGTWTREDWLKFLASGIDPQGHSPGGEMAQVIANTSALTSEDRKAMVTYLMTIPPVRRSVYAP